MAADVDAWRPDPQHLAAGSRVVVADPSRAGLGHRGVATVVACEARRVANQPIVGMNQVKLHTFSTLDLD